MRDQGLQPLHVSRRDTLTALVFESVQRAIVNKELAPGSRVSEASLAAALEVSKTPVRETLLRLRHIGLVEYREDGLCVIEPSIERVRNAYEYRAGLEHTSALYAARRATVEEMDRISEAAFASLSCALAADGDGFRSNDRIFHLAVAHAARNPMIENSVENALTLARALRDRDTPVNKDSVDCGGEHTQIAEAIRNRDEVAGDLMRAHVLHVMDLVLGSYSEAAPALKNADRA